MRTRNVGQSMWALFLVGLTALAIASCGGSSPPGSTSAADADVSGDAGDRFGDATNGVRCTPKTCHDLGFTCGKNGDGCGNVLDCGSCPLPAYCGGGGYSICGGDIGSGGCVPKTCSDLAYDCGAAGDGCGGALNCGSCTPPAFCGGGGFDKCGASQADGATSCTPATCQTLGYTCGAAGDGCGAQIDCGTCTAPDICGGGGFSKCGTKPGSTNPCRPTTCQQLGYTCGAAGDGCGNQLNCGTCSGPSFCGGGGFDQCGTNPVSSCVPTTCQALGYNCGPASDGCGGPLQCGSCVSPAYCGGGGFNKCGSGFAPDGAPISSCVPTTCQALGYNCGPASDGCGGLLQCGACNGGNTCGGGGRPGVCGTSIPCTGLCQQQTACAGGAQTTITGRIVSGATGAYIVPPFGADPVPNVLVYVPNAPLQYIGNGASCGGCSQDVSGSPLVWTRTDYNGTFTLVNVPVGSGIPVVIQLGRWRRGVTFDITNACATTAVGDIHMPRTQGGDAGDIPGSSNIPLTAVSTGNADAMECVLRKMGVAQSEFTANSGVGRVHVYVGNGAAIGSGTPAETALMGTTPTNGTYMNYDQILLPCWGTPTAKTSAALANLVTYANAGGRFFATHYSYTWLYQNAPFNTTANWDPQANQNLANAPFTGNVSTTVPASSPQLFVKWLNLVGALSNGNPMGIPPNSAHVTIQQGHHDVDGVAGSGVDWIDGTDPNPPSPAKRQMLLHYTFDTPVGASNKCGHVIYSDFDVDSLGATTGTTFPAECGAAAPPTAQERILEYMIWDLASCVGPNAPACAPQTCQQQNLACGPAGDGCGNLIDCGTCTGSQTCGGGGIPAHCGAPPDSGGPCAAQTCQQQNINCGPAGDGCGNALSCGACTPPQTCGGGNVPGRCGSPPDGGLCAAKTCAQQGIGCGPAGDGCGSAIDCGPCPAGQTCGGGGVPSQCGATSDGGACAAQGCAQQNIACGPAGDGCGNALNCGTCVAPLTCGGGGMSGRCGAPDAGACAPKTCPQQNVACGPAGDGCGNRIECGSCPTGQTCGGGGTPGHCGTGVTCAPMTCNQLGVNCGPAGDGCGGVLDCGQCVSPLACGGGGVPGQCGGGTH
jgi:hypothetical protein